MSSTSSIKCQRRYRLFVRHICQYSILNGEFYLQDLLCFDSIAISSKYFGHCWGLTQNGNHFIWLKFEKSVTQFHLRWITWQPFWTTHDRLKRNQRPCVTWAGQTIWSMPQQLSLSIYFSSERVLKILKKLQNGRFESSEVNSGL